MANKQQECCTDYKGHVPKPDAGPAPHCMAVSDPNDHPGEERVNNYREEGECRANQYRSRDFYFIGRDHCQRLNIVKYPYVGGSRTHKRVNLAASMGAALHTNGAMAPHDAGKPTGDRNLCIVGKASLQRRCRVMFVFLGARTGDDPRKLSLEESTNSMAGIATAKATAKTMCRPNGQRIMSIFPDQPARTSSPIRARPA